MHNKQCNVCKETPGDKHMETVSVSITSTKGGADIKHYYFCSHCLNNKKIIINHEIKLVNHLKEV